MSDSSSGTIRDHRLREEEFIVLHFSAQSSSRRVRGDTVRTKESNLYFFQVVDSSELVYKPILPRDSDGEVIDPIEPQSGVEYSQLFDENGDDILRNTDSPWRLYHGSVGVRQPGVRIYPRIPESIFGGGFDWLSGSEPNPTRGDNVGYVDSSTTDYDDPSDQLEIFSYKHDSLTEIQYGLYNEDEEISKLPVLSFVGYAYELRPVYEDQDMLEILAQLSKKEKNRSMSVRMVNFTPGSLRSYSFNVPSEWDGVENNLRVRDVNLPSGIEEQLGIRFNRDDFVIDNEDTEDELNIPRSDR